MEAGVAEEEVAEAAAGLDLGAAVAGAGLGGCGLAAGGGGALRCSTTADGAVGNSCPAQQAAADKTINTKALRGTFSFIRNHYIRRSLQRGSRKQYQGTAYRSAHFS